MSRNLKAIALTWLGLVAFLALPRIFGSPTPPADLAQLAQLALPYAFIALAPIAGFFIGRNAFLGAARRRSTSYQMAQFGSWKRLSVREAIRHPSFGPVGFMASLIVGMLINIVLRTFQFSLAIPALTVDAPSWGFMLFWIIAFSTVIMNFFYAVCFVMALRAVPLFPKMLLFTWMLDILLQLSIATQVAAFAPPVEVAAGLKHLLLGNMRQVLLSMLIWVPYIVLAERVNVTFRHRASA